MGTLQAFVRSLPLPDELGGKRRTVNSVAPALIAAYTLAALIARSSVERPTLSTRATNAVPYPFSSMCRAA
jgi:hypothetical protein